MSLFIRVEDCSAHGIAPTFTMKIFSKIGKKAVEAKLILTGQHQEKHLHEAESINLTAQVQDK
uniref:Uncharacterized protein n=1 Tax=Arion vulgaris TaxID=1028688 RepID=A0A0B7AV92_9EUPU